MCSTSSVRAEPTTPFAVQPQRSCVFDPGVQHQIPESFQFRNGATLLSSESKMKDLTSSMILPDTSGPSITASVNAQKRRAMLAAASHQLLVITGQEDQLPSPAKRMAAAPKGFDSAS